VLNVPFTSALAQVSLVLALPRLYDRMKRMATAADLHVYATAPAGRANPAVPRLELLQAGRALAAMAVLFYHAGVYAGHAFGSHRGLYGVDFFFLLSGYIHLPHRYWFTGESTEPTPIDAPCWPERKCP